MIPLLYGPDGKTPISTVPPKVPFDDPRPFLIKVIRGEGEAPEVMEVTRNEYRKYLRNVAMAHIDANYPMTPIHQKKKAVENMIKSPDFQKAVRLATLG